uniref:Spexin n=1 Tax=Scophthalmus maximus TaxID=52904 RepID=A0A8D3E7U6_SCOMX
MSLIVTLFVVTLVSQCWTTPQRRNWTPQAILYLKGARKSSLNTQLLSTHKQSSDGLGLSWASSLLLELVQLAMEEGKTLKVITNLTIMYVIRFLSQNFLYLSLFLRWTQIR